MALMYGAVIVCGCLGMTQLSYAVSLITQACPSGTNGECTTAVSNSKCNSTACVCADGFKEVSATNCTKVLSGTCTANTNTDCTTTVPNSQCVTSGSTSTCKCISGYNEVSNLCVVGVSGTTCSTGGTQCNAITNSACDSTSLKCKCNSGYKESTTSATCTKVLSGTCTANQNTDCTTTVPNSQCVTTGSTSTCKCISGHNEVSNLCVVGVSGTTCSTGGTQCNAITNSACDTTNSKCKCNSGYTESTTSATCTQNAAETQRMTSVLLATCFFVAGLRKLFN